jgi:hypothetical protein
MATIPPYTRTPVTLPGFERPSNAPPQTPPTGVGGGTSLAPVALDPRGLVPVNRTQPLANDGMEAQRMMERRLGSMPPSSFAGAGAGFVPVNRPLATGPISDPGTMRSDIAPTMVAPTQQTVPLSGQAMADVARQQVYDRAPVNRSMAAQRVLEALAARRGQHVPSPGRPPNSLARAVPALLPRRLTGLLGG